MKKLAVTIIKCIGFFLGWAIFISILPSPAIEDPAIWRLWAEAVPLFGIAVFTLLFWLIERRTIKLHLFDNPFKGVAVGIVAGIAWLGITVAILFLADIIEVDGTNQVPMFGVWLLAAFLNVVMQELLVRGYLYQMLKQTYNGIAATMVTTALFTLCHGGAFEAGILPVLNVLTMSLLMTAVLEYTGSMIAPTVMHFLWNGAGALFLGGVSLAEDYPHLLNMRFAGNDILSGGACKMEGSLVVLILNLALIFLFRTRRQVRHLS